MPDPLGSSAGLPREQVSVRADAAADLTGLSEYAIRLAINRGELRAKRLGTRILIPMDALRVWIDGLPDHESSA